MGGILDLARRDARHIINAGGFETEITFDPQGTPITVNGLATKHHLGYDEDGQRANVHNVQITVNEADLEEAGIIVRNSADFVNLIRKVVSYPDSRGISKTYVITETYPNETLGHIICILGDFEV